MAPLKRKAGGDAGADPKKARQGNITSFFGAPKPSPTAGSASKAGAEPPAIKFDKAKWVATLTPEQRKLLQLEIDTLHESWLSLLKEELVTKEFLELKKFLDRETVAGKKWFPPKEDVYSWSRHTPFNTVKIVILGQDPYHNLNQAHGLAFSVRPPTPAPPSLKNMYTCLKTDYPLFTPPLNKAGLLTPWAERGVLMLNTCLTVRAHEANSHSNRGWERFTQRVIDLVAARRAKGVVFLAWGTPAGKRVVKVDGKRHLVLKSVHPSPLSASRGFFTCGHFKKANEWLAERYGSDGRVDWALVEGASVFEEEDEGKEEEGGGVVEGEVEVEGEEEKKKKGSDEVEAAVVKASVVTGNVAAAAAVAVDGKEKETALEKKEAAKEAVEGDENAAPEVA
ncbi:hypothetical protein C8A00DRAFT_29215 [Chaetomidium leptoderma]|uniref:Uracil-DNA glycosylase n=1 Tax=Chaetomidium leptoderma TaxID=669021 RepID=A0AAN6VUD1_9PEZI|nr:hypothetical protein C8A00DRAFT_29215 [Chaetomidium leptoderma]